MPRIRSIHPGLFTDEAYMALSLAAMAAWPGVWIQADDQGVFEWKPLTLKARIMPAAMIDMSDLLAEYQAQDLVRRFESEGRSYGAIRNFRRYQRPEKPKIVHPLPDELTDYIGLRASPIDRRQIVDAAPTDHQQVDDQSPTPHRKSIQREEVRGKREEVRKKEGRITTIIPSKRPAREARSATGRSPGGDRDDEGEAQFDRFWKAYPRKANRGRAKKAWVIARQTQTSDQLLAAATRFAAENTGKPVHLVARPENWLDDQRWLDDPLNATVPNGPERGDLPFGGDMPFESPNHWRHRMQIWFDEERGGPIPPNWPANWGPAPGQPNCRVPPDVIAEFPSTQSAKYAR